MRTKVRPYFRMAALIGMALVVSGLLFTGFADRAQAQCHTPGMSPGTTMDHQNHSNEAEKGVVTRLMMSGQIAKVDKAKRTVTVTVEIPVDRQASWDQVGKLQSGDVVKVQLVSDKSGKLVATAITPDKVGVKSATLEAEKTYVCPMHAEVTSHKAGDNCPKCGMDLVEKK